jgi:SAM-dependent methyltransferase
VDLSVDKNVGMPRMIDDIRKYWNEDAATYDRASQHRPRSPLVIAAWTAALERLLPPPPARVLDCGAGTGFLSLIAARLGHRVTALDLSTAMLEHLRQAAASEELEIEIVEGPADQPDGEFDVVMERHLLWTLCDPERSLRAWRDVAPAGTLVLVEAIWGDADSLEHAKRRLRQYLRRLRGGLSEHHAEYPEQLRAALPLASGTNPSTLVELVASAGWQRPKMVRLGDVEWAEGLDLPMPERLLGVAPRFALMANSRSASATG